ncbi:MAG: hypothetical protein RLZ98_1061 [Pseudomonadota bacterium]
MNIVSRLFAAALLAVATIGCNASAQDKLPARLANDPVAKLLGPEIMNAALKEGEINWYAGTTTRDFLRNGGQERFEKRFGIKIKQLISSNRKLTDRIRTEVSVGRVVADVYDGNDQYMLELHKLGALIKWKPPAPELDRMNKKAFITDPVGYWWPVHVSAQGLVVNPKLVDPKSIKSYKDILDPKFKGKVCIRDPRSSGGGAWHMLGIYNTKGLGIDYIKKFKTTVEPFILSGGSKVIRDAVIRGQFAIGFSGRGDFFEKLPKGAPLAWVVPEEGLAWTPSSIAILKGSANQNAAKVVLTWFYEVEQLQLWTNHARPVPHPDVKAPIPEMDISNVPLMDRIPDSQLDSPDFFFKEMEGVFGIR